MMGTTLHWVNGPWPGKLAMAARPRGGELLEHEIANWSRNGIDTVVSLLEREEERDLEIAGEGDAVRAQGMTFLSFPIADRQVPESEIKFAEMLESLDQELTVGRNIALHCRQGIGRTGLVASCLFLARGFEPQAAMDRLSAARGVAVPETDEQRRWIERHAEAFVSSR